ncbi:MAG: hypothetical protein O3B13_22195 [Planctomycetota bacterium]|nr:hypothetical protein [Planctomycetota bacterium]
MKYVTTLFLLSVCITGFAQNGAPDLKKAAGMSATALVRPSGLYSDQLGIQSRKKLKAELKELRVQMAVMNRAAAELEKADDGTAHSAIVQNLVNLKVLAGLAKSLPLVARTIEDYRWDVFLLIDTKDAEVERLRLKSDMTQKRIDTLVQQILSAEEEGLSEIRIGSLKRELDQRLIQCDGQKLDAEESANLSKTLRDEVARLKTLDELLDGIAVEKGVYAERLFEGIEREASVAAPELVAEGIEEINDMIHLISSGENENQGKQKVKRSTDVVSQSPTVAIEVEAFSAAVRLKDPTRVEHLLDQARKARGN